MSYLKFKKMIMEYADTVNYPEFTSSTTYGASKPNTGKPNKHGLDDKAVKFLEVSVRGEWKQNPETGLVDVHGNVSIPPFYIKDGKLPVDFGEVTGYFWASNNNLTTLEGCPTKVIGDVLVDGNQLTSLKYAPSYIGGLIDIKMNKLERIDWKPEHVGGYIWLNLGDIPRENFDIIIPELERLIKSGIKIHDPQYYYYPLRNQYYERLAKSKN